MFIRPPGIRRRTVAETSYEVRYEWAAVRMVVAVN